jgi:glucitol operon activator protein
MIEQLAIAILLAWVLQMVLAYRQARIFYRRINSFKKMGRCATGLAGGRYRGRTYVALVADPQTRVLIKAEQLRGLTVFAGLKPIPQLEGKSLDELLAPNVLSIDGVPQRVIEAARSAAGAIQTSLNKATIPASSPVLP